MKRIGLVDTRTVFVAGGNVGNFRGMNNEREYDEDVPVLVRLVNSGYRGEDGQVGWNRTE
jgi:hypothetical protein